MKSIFAKEFSRIELGYRGENLARQVVFDLSEWQKTYGEGMARLVAQIPSEPTPYPCSVIREGDVLLWPLSCADTSVAGKGQCELSYYVGDRLVKSAVFSTYIAESLAPVGEAPEPQRAWVEDVFSASADALAAKAAIEGMIVSAEALPTDAPANVIKSEEDGKVHLTFLLPRGERGERGDRGEKGEIGPTGEKGDPPLRGVDYFTPEDMAYFDARIDERLGEVGAALDELHAYAQTLVGGDAV